MNHQQQYIYFEGLSAGVAVKADAAFFATLPGIFSHWPFTVVSTPERDIFARIDQNARGYLLSSPFLPKAEQHREPINTICALVAEMAWVRLREDPSLLCLHGAAAEFAGRLVVFPATRRAGKSTLSVAMAAAGIRMFTDDFLPLSIADTGIISGISSGISPRLRLPMPEQIGPVAGAYLSRRETLSNGQYTYVAPLATESARYGEAAPLGGAVFLDRQDGATAELKEISKADALKTLIRQNFSRAGNAGDILAMLEFLAQNLPVYALRYDAAEPAIALLKQQFTSWTTALPKFQPKAVLTNEIAAGIKPFTTYRDVSSGQFAQASGVHVVAADGKRFLTGRNGQSIHYLNEGAAMIWQILADPTSIAEAIEILHAAFPEQPLARIKKDVQRSFANFAKNGLLQRLEPLSRATPTADKMRPEMERVQ